jgi:hypothetical protein
MRSSSGATSISWRRIVSSGAVACSERNVNEVEARRKRGGRTVEVLAFVVELFMLLAIFLLAAIVVASSVLFVAWALRKEPPKPTKDAQG